MYFTGVIGAGVMGQGVAQALAEHGRNVMLYDIHEQALTGAKQGIAQALRFRALFQKEAPLEMGQTLDRISYTTKITDLVEAEYLIENATEDMGVKSGIYQELSLLCRDELIVMANTSCISITLLASHMSCPGRVIGTHFMNPVPQIDTVEVIRGYHTTEETVEATVGFLDSLGKEAVVVKDYPGFVANRISHLMMNEAAFIIQDGVAGPEEIDKIFKKCYGHKMGPLETADLIGLDTVVQSLEVLYQCYQDSKFRCCPLLKKMVQAGLLGKKTQKGFYTY